MHLGAVLRAARVDAGLLQRQVAAAAGVTIQALSRWETGARPVRSDDADRVLAACGRDVRFTVVLRTAHVTEALDALAAMPLSERLLEVGMWSDDTLAALQATGGVTFTGAWAAAALGLPPLHHVGGLRICDDERVHAAVAEILAPLSVFSNAPGGPWAITWDAAVFQRNPDGTYISGVLGEFTAAVVQGSALDLTVPTEAGRWRVVPPEELVPDTIDQATLDCWRARMT